MHNSFPEFVPGQMWTGSKDYANDPDATPSSVNSWGSNVSERDVANLQSTLKQMGIGSANGGSGGMSDFSMGLKGSDWNAPSGGGGAGGFGIGGGADMWRQPAARMSTGSGSNSNKSWNSGPYGAPGIGPGGGSLGGGPSGGNAKWQQSMRNQSMSGPGGGYQNFGPSNMSPQRPNMGPGSAFTQAAFRGSSGSNNAHGNQGGRSSFISSTAIYMY